jgi:hypothetical protein
MSGSPGESPTNQFKGDAEKKIEAMKREDLGSLVDRKDDLLKGKAPEAKPPAR